MTGSVDLGTPDPHLDPMVASSYDEVQRSMFAEATVTPAVERLAALAAGGTAVEFAVGTGRLAVPLAARDVTVHGIDLSASMLAELRKKPGASAIEVHLGDMTSTVVCTGAELVYLVFNTVMNLRTQAQQVACFGNAAAHLAPDGRFVVETIVPQVRHLGAGDSIRPFDVSPHHLGFDEYVDLVRQISVSHHYFIDGDRVRTQSSAFRYVWPSELDLMAELAGMSLESRWADWRGAEFTGDSPSHVSVWRKH